MNDNQIVKLISFSVLIILLISIDAFFLAILNTTSVWFFGFIFYFSFLKGLKFKSNFKNESYIKMYLFWIILASLYGIVQSESYWDYKGLIMNSFCLFFPVSIYALSNVFIVQKLLRVYIQYAVPFFFVFAVFAPSGTYGYYLSPVTLLLLFFPLFPKKNKIILLFMVVIVFMSSLGARTTIISFGFVVVLVLVNYVKFLNRRWLFNYLRLFLLFIPFLLFILASSNIFNIFNLQEVTGTELQTKSINGKGEEFDENLLADTRTFIYKEVLFSSIKNDYWLYGRSPARGNDTVYFSDMDMVENRSERLRNEVGILNVFTWTGLIGVFLYFLIFYKASYLAINNSNNSLSKFIGVYISFRWFNSWVAEISNFDLINFTIWVAVALCFSKTFRSMTDSELKSWVKGITNKRMKKI